MAAVAYAAYIRTQNLFPDDTVVNRLICVSIPMAAAIAVYLAISWYFGIPELKSFARLLARKRGGPA
jgi:hypothetical protein